ncbi:hypothetical protein E2C06_04645 [Dankookia rubra]|uniref:Uncharacterized protein n=1 Tax=Dankookia rubra TaxID=1442381 RepID=A0A4R5QKK9_9PROT|nr:hypothetical protein [Dankookia rubra]TDH63623.1 hypothetical protein E2C06_04645 [Dankookia rubra]
MAGEADPPRAPAAPRGDPARAGRAGAAVAEEDAEARGIARALRHAMITEARRLGPMPTALVNAANLHNPVARRRFLLRLREANPAIFHASDRTSGGKVRIEAVWFDIAAGPPIRPGIAAMLWRSPARHRRVVTSWGVGMAFSHHAQERAVRRLGAVTLQQQSEVLHTAWRYFGGCLNALGHGDRAEADWADLLGRSYLVPCFAVAGGRRGLAVIDWESFVLPRIVTVLDADLLRPEQEALFRRFLADGRCPPLTDVEAPEREAD